jgi:hypothetical protein
VSTKRCREASCFCKLEAHHVILTGLPAKSLGEDVRVRGKSAAGCLPASRAMTFYEFEEWQVCFKLNRSAKTSTAHDHVSVSQFWCMRRNIHWSPRSIQRPQAPRQSRLRTDGSITSTTSDPRCFGEGSLCEIRTLDCLVERDRAGGRPLVDEHAA